VDRRKSRVASFEMTVGCGWAVMSELPIGIGTGAAPTPQKGVAGRKKDGEVNSPLQKPEAPATVGGRYKSQMPLTSRCIVCHSAQSRLYALR
jgi:hypothetical protein